MPWRRPRLHVQLTAEDLPDLVLGQREDILVGRNVASWRGHPDRLAPRKWAGTQRARQALFDRGVPPEIALQVSMLLGGERPARPRSSTDAGPSGSRLCLRVGGMGFVHALGECTTFFAVPNRVPAPCRSARFTVVEWRRGR